MSTIEELDIIIKNGHKILLEANEFINKMEETVNFSK